MRRLTYYRVCLVLPILVCLLAWLLKLAGLSHDLISNILLSAMAAGPPYLLTFIVLMIASFKMTIDHFIRCCYFSPFFAAFIIGFCILGFTWYISDAERGYPFSWGYVWMMWAYGAVHCLLKGYLYVALVSMGSYLMRKSGFLQS